MLQWCLDASSYVHGLWWAGGESQCNENTYVCICTHIAQSTSLCHTLVTVLLMNDSFVNDGFGYNK